MKIQIWNDILRAALVMSISGGVIALVLLLLGPLLKRRFPKSIQYYLWHIVLVSLLVPFSAFIILPNSVAKAVPMLSAPVYSIVAPYELVGQGTADELGPSQSQKPDQSVQSPPAYNQIMRFIAEWYWIVWPLGAAIFLGINVTGYIRFSRRIKKSSVAPHDSEIALLAALSKRVVPPRLVRNGLVPAPMLCGILRPTILLPDRDYTDEQLQCVFLHELIHRRRQDVLVKWMSVLAGAVHWFNPVVYLARREIERLCELSCDEAVIRRLDRAGKQNYGDTLIMALSDSTPARATFSLSMSADKKAMKERLHAILVHRKPPKRIVLSSGVLLALTICVSVLMGAAAYAKTPPDKANALLSVSSSSPVSSTSDDKKPIGSGVQQSSPLPAEKEITFMRDGKEETAEGRLYVSGIGYAIYVAPDYTVQTINGRTKDVSNFIEPGPDSAISPDVFMQIYAVDPATPLPGDKKWSNFCYHYERIAMREKVFEIQYKYFTDRADSGYALLKAMADTVCAVDISEYFPDYSPFFDKGL